MTEVAEPEILTRSQAYANVYTHLKSQDIAPMVEKKKISNSFQPDFLSWTHVWEFLLQTYPEFELEHLPPIKHDDGTMTVECKLTIPFAEHRLVRSERLYVMDNRMNAIQNPNAQAINKADKRCFVKCAALFGLGIQLFTGEDLPDGEAIEPPPPIAKPEPTPEPVVESQLPDDPTLGTELLVQWAKASLKHIGTSDSVRSVWAANKAWITTLENDHPDVFKKLMQEFTQLTKQIKEEESSNGN
tara:strand:+ start:473 stop:1204 length:732 start_codon:yes stop_codon:yes gene_type:complete